MKPTHPILEGSFSVLPPGHRVPEYLGVRYERSNPKHIAVTVHGKILGGSQASLMEYLRSALASSLAGADQNPEAVVTLLMMMMQVISDNGLARRAPNGDKSSPEMLMRVPGGHHVPCVDMYLETLTHVESVNLIVGYRFHFFFLDPTVDMNWGLTKLIARNQAAQPPAKDVKVHPVTQLIGSVKRINTFIDLILRRVMRDLRPGHSAYALPLYEDVNQVNVYRVFALENSIPTSKIMLTTGNEPMLSPDGLMDQDEAGGLIYHATGEPVLDGVTGMPTLMPSGVPMRDAQGNVLMQELVSGSIADLDPVFTNLDNYMFEEQHPAGGMRLVHTFPRGALRIHFKMQNPGVIYSLRLFETPASLEWTIGKTQMYVDDLILNRVEDAHALKMEVGMMAAAEEDDEADMLHKLNEAELERLTPEEARAAREGPLFAARFAMLADPMARISPAYKAVYVYLDECKLASRRDHQREFSAITLDAIPIVDPRMSWFANMQAHFAICLESLVKVATLHHEILMAWTACMAVPEHRRGLKVHVIFAGEHSTGKSLIQEILKLLMIMGTYEQISRKTAQADTTQVDKDGMMQFEDELQERFFLPDGDGQDKEKLTTGMLRTQGIFIGENGKREAVTCTSRHSGATIGGTNKIVGVSAPTRSRHAIHSVTQFDQREGRSSTECMLKHINQMLNADVRSDTGRFIQHCKTKQMLVTLAYELMYAGSLAPVDLTVCDVFLVRFMKHLNDGGTPFLPRDFDRIHRLVIALTVMTAVHIVFFTRTVFQEQKPFEMKQLMELQPYLFATEEITIFALTNFSSMFFHSQEHLIMKSCALNNLGYTGKGVTGAMGFHCKGQTDKNPKGVEDKNYIEFTGLMSGYLEPVAVAADQISTKMRDVDVKAPKGIVHDVLLQLRTRKIRTKYYDDRGELIQQEQDMDILISSHRSLLINRFYLDRVLQTDAELDFFNLTIRKMQHAHTPRQKIVLGTTMRYSRDKFYPHILRTMELTNMTRNEYGDVVPIKEIEVVDFTQLDAAYLALFRPGSVPQSNKILIDDDLEQVKWIEFVHRLGWTWQDAHDSPAMPSVLRHGPLSEIEPCVHCHQRVCDHRDYPATNLRVTAEQAVLVPVSLKSKRPYELARCPTPPAKRLTRIEDNPKTLPPGAPPPVNPLTAALQALPSDQRRALLEQALAAYREADVMEEEEFVQITTSST